MDYFFIAGRIDELADNSKKYASSKKGTDKENNNQATRFSSMDTLYIFVLIVLLYCFLYFFHLIMLSCSIFYCTTLRNMQLEIEVFRIRWFTSAFNQTIKVWTTNRIKFWHAWFDVGVFVTILLLPLSILILVYVTMNIFLQQPSLHDNESGQVLQIMVPGVDIPVNEIGYYITSILACTVWHEMGHAISAVSEDVRLYGFGFLLAFIVPIAYVQISNEKLILSPMRSQLRIMCAGVWHNLVLTIMAVMFLNLDSWLYKPLYSTNTGISVRMILPNSPLIGPTGLMIHDIVYKINDCSVTNSQEWNDCILNAMRKPNPGYCASEDFVRKYDDLAFTKPSPAPLFDCCDEKMKEHGHLCFQFIRNSTNITIYSCLPARVVITQSHNYCPPNFNCLEHRNYCLQPCTENITKVVKIQRLNKKDVLFIGDPADIFRTVVVSNWLPKFAGLSPEFPETINIICNYIVIFSSGLAIVNVIPCFYFDGHYIIDIIILTVLQFTTVHQRFHRLTTLSIKIGGTLLLSINLLYMLLDKLF